MDVHVHYTDGLTAKLAPHGRRNHLGGVLRGEESTGCWGRAAMPANMSSEGAACAGVEGVEGEVRIWKRR